MTRVLTAHAKIGSRLVINFKFIAMALIASLWVATASAQSVIVISDIDDTLQDTRLRPPDASWTARITQSWHLLTQAFKAHDAFVGLTSVYMSLAANGAQIHYVSGAPKFIERLPKKFLEVSGFPVGQLWVRPNMKVTTEEFKFNSISEILLKNPDAQVILVGDNGERDVTVYNRLKSDSRFKNQIKLVFIHNLYPDNVGESLAPGQKPYLTAADLAAQLLVNGFLSEGQTFETLRLVSSGLQSNFRAIRGRALPPFVRPRSSDLAFFESVAVQIKSNGIRNLFRSVLDQIANRNSIRASWCSGLLR